ncbi:hypothetical protein [Vreelandella aquamarina]|uniref:hypothetical protein n=1 Tax=Vreelandella aquamarina TaxID=77097 RepID=UPI00157FC0A2|nr:hypothetical protein [Halomonas meridiana]
MDVRTFGELIDWTRQLHEHLAACLAHCADIHEEERARMLLNYLAAQEAEMQRVVARFEQTADAKALKTYVYDYLEHKPIRTHRTEPPRLYRRLHILRGWSYELTKTIFPRSPGASCSISP